MVKKGCTWWVWKWVKKYTEKNNQTSVVCNIAFYTICTQFCIKYVYGQGEKKRQTEWKQKQNK